MTALLSAEGLTRPALAPPVIIGSVSGPGSTNVNRRAGAGRRVPRPRARPPLVGRRTPASAP